MKYIYRFPNCKHKKNNLELKNNETRLVVKYNVNDVSNPTQLYLYSDGLGQAPFEILGIDMFSKVEIDGTEIPVSDLDNTEGKFRFDSTGEHTVKYTLKDPTFMGAEFNLDYSELLKLGAVFVGCTLITEVIIPDSVVIIGDSAFYNCSNLISVTIGNSVNIIGELAFYSCYDLTSVNIPSSVTTIKTSAFEVCGLTSVIIPNGVTSIGSLAFLGCSDLTSVVLPDSITNIDEGAFANCDALSLVNIPNSINTLNDIFSGCYSLTSVTIPNSITSIGERAFWNCSGLTSVIIPNSVISIGFQAFTGCDGLTSLNVASGNTVYDSRNNCNAIIETATNKLIQGCKVTIIPNTVTTIGESAFYGCNSLTSITIPNNVINIENYAFYDCNNLSSITIEATTPPILGNYTFIHDNCPIYVPAESVQAYKTAWPEYADRILGDYEYIDLGLPSHTLWATKNIGATNITDYGNYYMYGMGNKIYNNTDTPYAGTENPLTLSKDTARQTWRGQWHTPLNEQIEELITNTTYLWVTNYNGSNVNGGLFTAQNGNSIFFPAAGEYWANGTQHSIGNTGSYWSSSPDSDSINYAYYLSFYDNTAKLNGINRSCGFSIRPVIGYPQK